MTSRENTLLKIDSHVWYLADVLNKLECGDVDHSIDFARYRVEWLCSLLVRLGGSLEEILGLTDLMLNP